MGMFGIKKLKEVGPRKILRGLLLALLVAIILPLVSEFFIRVADEQGFFTNPTGKIRSAMNWLSGFMGNFYFWLALPLIVGLTGGVWLDYLLKKTRKNEITKKPSHIQTPNYEAWNQVNEFTLLQAAFLWAEAEPVHESLESLEKVNGKAWLTMLEDAAAVQKDLHVNLSLDKAIKLHQREENVINMHTRVSRDELRKFAVKRDLHPRFLFPDPKSPKPSQQSLNKLAELLSEGIHEILNRQVSSVEEANKLYEYEKSWNERLFSLLDAEFTRSDALHVQRLGTIPTIHFGHVDMTIKNFHQHEKILREFAVRQERIADLVKKGPAKG